MNIEQKRDLLVIGLPGSGSRKLSSEIAMRNQGMLQVNFSQVLRFIALTKEHFLREDVFSHLREGKQLSPDLLKEILTEEIQTFRGNTLVFDGFVSNPNRFESFESVMERENRSFMPIVVHATVESCINRLLRQSTEKEEKGIEVDNDYILSIAREIRKVESLLGIPKVTDNRSLEELYSRVHEEKGYYGTAWKEEIRKRMFEQFIKEHKGVEVIDLGCRDGHLTNEITQNRRLTGVDIDSKALERYKIRHVDNNPTVIQHDLNTPLDIDNNSFDIAIAGEIIEHLREPEQFVSEVHRILKPGGIFTGSTPNAFRWDKRLQWVAGRDPKEFNESTHLKYFSQGGLLRLLSKYFRDDVHIFPYRGNKEVSIFARLISDGFIWHCTK